MKRYKIYRSATFLGLETYVNEEIEKGWVPIGGVQVIENKNQTIWAQALYLEINK